MLDIPLIMTVGIFIILLSFISGFALGTAKKEVHNLVGTLRVDNSIPEDGPQLYLELEKNIPEIKNRDYVTLRVNTENYISRN